MSLKKITHFYLIVSRISKIIFKQQNSKMWPQLRTFQFILQFIQAFLQEKFIIVIPHIPVNFLILKVLCFSQRSTRQLFLNRLKFLNQIKEKDQDVLYDYFPQQHPIQNIQKYFFQRIFTFYYTLFNPPRYSSHQ